jgi:hypothetical protein
MDSEFSNKNKNKSNRPISANDFRRDNSPINSRDSNTNK